MQVTLCLRWQAAQLFGHGSALAQRWNKRFRAGDHRGMTIRAPPGGEVDDFRLAATPWHSHVSPPGFEGFRAEHFLSIYGPIADEATPTSIKTITATIMPEASARASDSMIRRPMPRSAPMNSPTMTPIRAKDIAGDNEANTQAMVEGITTVRVICHSLAPSSRAALMNPSSMERAPSKVLKNTRNTTTIHDVTIFDVSPIPNASTMIGANAILGMEFTAVMKG